MDYIDLTIRISPAGDNVTVAYSSPVGSGECVCSLAEHLGLADGEWLPEAPASEAADTRDFARRSAHRTGDVDARQLGTRLYRALFHAELQSAFDKAVGAAQSAADRGVRIRIAMDVRGPGMARVARLPWELLCATETEPPFSVSIRTPLVRSIDVPEPVDPAPLRMPLRILAIPSNPRDTPPLDLGKERERIESDWALLPGVQVDFVRPITSEILGKLADHEYHVIHYMGHGAIDEESGRGLLLLEHEDGSADPVDSERLRVMFGDETTLRLVFLNACNTGAMSDRARNPFLGVAAALIREGVPAVLAMRTPIRDGAAIRFAGTFYRRIARGQPIDTAVSEARKELWDGQSTEWAVPVLFMRSRDGALFRMTEPGAVRASPAVPLAAAPAGATAAASEVTDPAARTVFLTATNDALRPLRRRLTKELKEQGIRIASDVPPPFESAQHEAGVREGVRGADLTVHLLDEQPGEAVEDAADGRTYTGEQLRIGLESARSQLVLVPEQADLDRIEQPGYAELFRSLTERPRDADRLQVVHTAPARMLDEIVLKLRKLDEARARNDVPKASVDAVFVDLHAQDMANANDLVSYLVRRHITPIVMPTVEETTDSAFTLFENTLKKVQLCFVVYGGVGRDRVLHRLNAAVQVITLNGLSTRVCVYVAPPVKPQDQVRFPPFYEVASGMGGFEPATIDGLIRRAAGAQV